MTRIPSSTITNKFKLAAASLACALLCVLALGLRVAAQRPAAPTAKMSKVAVKPEEHKVADLRPMVKDSKKLKEGDNLLFTSDKGIKFFAKVKDGRVVDYPAKDAQGRDLKSSNHKSSAAGATVCWVCKEDSSGTLHCAQVPCPDAFPVSARPGHNNL